MRVIVTMTTMPDKYHKIVKTLETINKQTRKPDAIYLGLPKKSRRLGIEYPPLPKEAEKLCTTIEVPDFGPITKLIAGLTKEQDPDTVIITFDDDMIYPPTMIEKLLEKHKEYPDSAIGSSGMLLKNSFPLCAITPNENNMLYRFPKFQIPKQGRKVDCIYGYPGALYVRKFFPSYENLEKELLNYALIDNNMLMNDDIIISGYFSLKKIERRIFPNFPEVAYVRDEKGGRARVKSEISYSVDRFFKRLNSAIETSRNLGMYSQLEYMGNHETIAVLLMIIVFSLAIILFLSVHLIKTKNIGGISF